MASPAQLMKRPRKLPNTLASFAKASGTTMMSTSVSDFRPAMKSPGISATKPFRSAIAPCIQAQHLASAPDFWMFCQTSSWPMIFMKPPTISSAELSTASPVTGSSPITPLSRS